MSLGPAELRSSANLPIVSCTLGMLGPSTAANFGAAAGIALKESSALMGDIMIKLVTTTETTAISATDWGGSTVTAVTVIDDSTGNPVSATALASGTYRIPVDAGAALYRSLIFTKSAAVNAGTAVVSAPYQLNANI